MNQNVLAIETRGLAVAPAKGAAPVLDGVALRIPRKCRAALVGANGAGKTTLLRALAGLLPPVAGEILIEGSPATLGNPRLAYLAQRQTLDWNFPVTVRKAVLAGRYPRLGWLRRPTQEDRDKTDAALARMGLSDLALRPLHALSGGQQQRALVARALCQEPSVLLLDEPFSGLDAASGEILDGFIANAPASGLTVLIATHAHEDFLDTFDIVLRIHDGGVSREPRAAHAA
ncbi:MAG: ATP-binding cassette domain-containing protein [Puniceicoccales bacterium]|nr:ATP-binding cassette domain-containing protein [Puniceicoccales bacterium]